jgi:cell division protein FtsB
MPKLGRAPQIIAFLLVLGLLGAMAIEPTRQLLDQRDRISSVAGELGDVQKSNAELQAQIERLKDDDYLEQLARERIGLVRPGETTYVVMPPSDQEQRASEKHRKAQQKVEPPPPPTFLDSVIDFVFGF